VSARDPALLDHRDRHLAEKLCQLGLVFEKSHEPVGAGQAGWAGADDRDADLDPLIDWVGWESGELLGRVDWGRVSAGCDARTYRSSSSNSLCTLLLSAMLLAVWDCVLQVALELRSR
jgi:hypothetical protein